MSKMKVFELKNTINDQGKSSIESKDILDFIEKSFGVKKSHSSNLEDNEVQFVKNHFLQANKPVQAQTTRPAAETTQKPASQVNTRPTGVSQGGPQAAGQTGARPQSIQEHSEGARPAGGQSQGKPMQQSSQVNQAGARPTAGQQSINRQGQPGQTSGQRPAGEQGHQSTLGQRPAGGQSGMRQGQQGQQGQGYQSSHSGQRPAGEQNQHIAGQRPQGQDGQRSAQNYQGQRPAAQEGQRPARPAGDNSQGQRTPGQGYQGQRPSGEGHRPQGQDQRMSGQGYQGNRPSGEGYQGNRPQGQGYQGNRPSGEGYQGNRPSGQGYQGNRPSGEGYQGNRPQGQGYQGNRPSGEGYQGNRPSGQGYQGNRPQGQGGSRPYGAGGQQGGRSGYGSSGGFSRPSGGQKPAGGFGSRGFDDTGKDDDDKPSFGNRAPGKKSVGRGGSERKNFDQQILDQKVAEKNDNSNKRNRDRINKEKTYREKNMVDRDESEEIKAKSAPKKGQFIQPKPVQVVEEEIKVITIPEVLTIKELADAMKKPSAALIKKLFLSGKIVTLNQEITFEEAEEIALEYEIIAEKEKKINEVEELLKEDEENLDDMEKRPPVVCVMGHVDHGKTSLLDAIRETNVTSREAGGITQHIGAYVVEVNGEKITFLDTPGHEAFTSMRKRGAKSTDIAILVVAADDGVMPQTIEAINHAKAAGVQIIVAINKIDKPSANVERVKQELTEYELIAEDWGGDTIFVPVSAHTKEGIEHLLEMILLTAEMVELKANPNRNARGIVIEAELDKGRGPVATILVQKGTLHVGDNVAVGASFGKVRAMMDDNGRRVKEATPSTPVEILGLNEVPDAGETFLAVDSEKEARTIAEAYLSQSKERLLADTKAKLSLDGLFSQIQAGNIKDLNLIIKADVQGSVEAMKQSLLKLSNNEVAVRIIHGGVGAINESDVILASASNAIIIGFNVKPDNAAKETADREKVDVKLYRVIYNAINDIEAAMKGMLDPVFEERIIGHAEIRMTFKASGVGTIAGSYVLDGKIIRGSKARIFRDNSVIYEGSLASLKRFQDDVKEVATGYECGLVFEKFNDVREGDKVELYIMAEVPR